MVHTKNGIPLFNENNYALWKGRMEIYLLVQGYKVWDTVQNGFTPTIDEQGKNNLVNDAKSKNIIINGLIESPYHKVLGCKTAKNVWDKLENIYAGDSNVKEAKLQIYKEKFEQLRMKEDDNIAAYFQHVDEITNTLEGLGELVDEKTIIQKILRTLSRIFNPKVSVLEYSENMAKLSKEELHGVLIAYEMRLDEEHGTSHLEIAFATSKKTNKDKQPSKEKTRTCKCEEKEDDEEGFSDGEYAYFTRKLKTGKGKFKECRTYPRNQYNSRRSVKYEPPRAQRNINRFEHLRNNIECYKFLNFGHIARDCKIENPLEESSKTQNKRTWKKKKADNCTLALKAQNNKDVWCVS
eukprot:PITA_03873